MAPLISPRRQVKAVCVVHQDVTEKQIWEMLEKAAVLEDVVHVELRIYPDTKAFEGNTAYIVFTNPGSAELVHYNLHFRLPREARIRIIYIAPDDTQYKTTSHQHKIRMESTTVRDNTSTQDTSKAEKDQPSENKIETGNPIRQTQKIKIKTENPVIPTQNQNEIETPIQLTRNPESKENQVHLSNGSSGNRSRADSGSTDGSVINDWIPARPTYCSVGRFTNLYVKNIPLFFTEEILKRSFSIHGKIKSCRIMTDELRKSRGFGFVDYERAEDAARAYSQMNGLTMANERILYVAPAQKRTDRETELRKKYALLEAEEKKCMGQVGVYMLISNLDCIIREQDLWDLCRPFGRVHFVTLVPGYGQENGHGFVRFLSRDEASVAVIKLHGCRLGTQNLDVRITPRRGIAKGINILGNVRPNQNVIIPATKVVRQSSKTQHTPDETSPRKCFLANYASGAGNCFKLSGGDGDSEPGQMKRKEADSGEQTEVPIIPAPMTPIAELTKRAQGINLNGECTAISESDLMGWFGKHK